MVTDFHIGMEEMVEQEEEEEISTLVEEVIIFKELEEAWQAINMKVTRMLTPCFQAEEEVVATIMEEDVMKALIITSHGLSSEIIGPGKETTRKSEPVLCMKATLETMSKTLY